MFENKNLLIVQHEILVFKFYTYDDEPLMYVISTISIKHYNFDKDS